MKWPANVDIKEEKSYREGEVRHEHRVVVPRTAGRQQAG